MDDIFEQQYALLQEAAQKANIPFDHALKQYKYEVLPYLQATVELLRQTVGDTIRFMEIGLCYGGNFVLAGNILQAYFKDRKVIGLGLDLPNQQRWGGGNINPVDTVKQLGATFDHQVIVGNSRDEHIVNSVKQFLGASQFDLLFIDGDHSKGGCEADYNNYSPLVRSGGIVGVHDIVEYPKWKHVEVWKVWADLKPHFQHKEFSISNNYGIGILVKP